MICWLPDACHGFNGPSATLVQQLICYEHLRLIHLKLTDIYHSFAFPLSSIYRSERLMAGSSWICLGCMLCLVSNTRHYFTHHSAHDCNTWTSILYKCADWPQVLTRHKICRRSETQDPSPTYVRSLPHKPDEGKKSHMFRSRIRNRLQHHHTMHPLPKNGLCLLKHWSLTMIMMMSPQIKYPNAPEHQERCVYMFLEAQTTAPSVT